MNRFPRFSTFFTTWRAPFTILLLSLATFIFTTALPHTASLPHVNALARNFITDRTDLISFYSITGQRLGYETPTAGAINTYPPLVFFFLLFLRAATHLTNDTFLTFSLLFSTCMAASLLTTFFLTKKILRTLNRSEAWLWLLTLPSLLYFSLSRFDNTLALFILASLFFMHQKNFPRAFLFLTLGILWKWITALLVPIYFLYMMYEYQQSNYAAAVFTKIKKSFLIFFTLLIITHLIAIILFGAKDVFGTYLLQIQRPFELGSFWSALFGGPTFGGTTTYPGFLTHLSPLAENAMSTLATFLAFLPTILIFFWFEKTIERHKTPFTFDHVLLWSTISIISFALWTKIYSPQWIWWFIPLLALTVRNKKTIFFIILLDILNYLLFPILFTYLELPHIPELIHLTTLFRTTSLLTILLLTAKPLSLSLQLKYNGNNK